MQSSDVYILKLKDVDHPVCFDERIMICCRVQMEICIIISFKEVH